MIPAFIEWNDLLTVIWTSLAAGIGVTSAFGVAILGGTRAVELGRGGRVAPATAFGILGALGLLTVIAAVVFGIIAIAAK